MIKVFSRVFFYAFVALGAVISLFPFYWMIVNATLDRGAIFSSPAVLIPGGHLLENLGRLEDSIGIGQVMLNSIGIAVVYTILSAVVSTMCGYGLAKYRFRGRQLVFGALLVTIMVPTQVLLIPLFQMMAAAGWIDSYQAVVLPFLLNGFGIFLMRQGFLQFPEELIEAGRLDGAGDMRIFYRIVLPAARPQLGALVIFTFMAQWNAFIWPLLVLNSPSKFTVPVALNSMVGVGQVDYPGLMLGATLATIPMLVIFLLFQKQFVAGLLGGAVRG